MPTVVDLQPYISQRFYNDLEVVYDIGASDGSYSKEIYSSVNSNPKFYLFEADSKYSNQQHDFNFEFHNVVFSDSEKTVDFYSNGTSGDSYYVEFTGVYNNVQPVKRETKTLDKYRVENNIPLPDMIKIDTQGSELDILRGGKECLSHAKLVILECPILPYNMGAPKFEEYINFMAENDFLPNYTTQLHWLNGIMVQMDIAFINTKGM